VVQRYHLLRCFQGTICERRRRFDGAERMKDGLAAVAAMALSTRHHAHPLRSGRKRRYWNDDVAGRLSFRLLHIVPARWLPRATAGRACYLCLYRYVLVAAGSPPRYSRFAGIPCIPLPVDSILSCFSTLCPLRAISHFLLALHYTTGAFCLSLFPGLLPCPLTPLRQGAPLHPCLLACCAVLPVFRSTAT